MSDDVLKAYEAELEKFGLNEKRKTGELFKLTFLRKTVKIVDNQVICGAGEPWQILCRFGVKKGVKGADPNRRDYDITNGFITVYAMEGPVKEHGFRRVAINTIVSVSSNKD